MSTKALKASSLPLPKKSVNMSNRRKSSPMPKKLSRTPTPVKFNSHANKMIDLKLLMNSLPDDIRNRITRKAILEETVQQKDMYKNDDKYVIIGENLSLKKIIKTFELDYFNYNDKEEYKDAGKRYIVKDNETILADIYSRISEEPDSRLTHMYCYKTIKIDNSDNYEIILANIPLFKEDINDNNNEEYIRTYYTEDDLNSIDFHQPQFNIRRRIRKCHNKNEYYIKDEHQKQIIKKLKYKHLINIFNPEIEDYSKVVNKLKSLSKSPRSQRSIGGAKKKWNVK